MGERRSDHGTAHIDAHTDNRHSGISSRGGNVIDGTAGQAEAQGKYRQQNAHGDPCFDGQDHNMALVRQRQSR